MINLERLERAVLIFLIAVLVLAVSISAFKKIRNNTTVTVERFDPAGYKNSRGESLPLSEKIDINHASSDELMKINGIGEKIAGRIVDYRYQNGGFTSIDEIKNVKGVNVALFEKIKHKITVE